MLIMYLYHDLFLCYYSICMAHNNCEAVIRILEVSHEPSIIPGHHMEQVLMMHTIEQLDRVMNIMVALFPHDLCQKISSPAWNKLLSQCCSQKRSAKAMQLFHYMSSSSIKIDKKVGRAFCILWVWLYTRRYFIFKIQNLM